MAHQFDAAGLGIKQDILEHSFFVGSVIDILRREQQQAEVKGLAQCARVRCIASCCASHAGINIGNGDYGNGESQAIRGRVSLMDHHPQGLRFNAIRVV